jgi:hypothetical protein
MWQLVNTKFTDAYIHIWVIVCDWLDDTLTDRVTFNDAGSITEITHASDINYRIVLFQGTLVFWRVPWGSGDKFL